MILNMSKNILDKKECFPIRVSTKNKEKTAYFKIFWSLHVEQKHDIFVPLYT